MTLRQGRLCLHQRHAHSLRSECCAKGSNRNTVTAPLRGVCDVPPIQRMKLTLASALRVRLRGAQLIRRPVSPHSPKHWLADVAKFRKSQNQLVTHFCSFNELLSEFSPIFD